MPSVVVFGDHDNCRCPWCGMYNHAITLGYAMPWERKVFTFQKPCTHCGQAIAYAASWEIKVVAERVATAPAVETVTPVVEVDLFGVVEYAP